MENTIELGYRLSKLMQERIEEPESMNEMEQALRQALVEAGRQALTNWVKGLASMTETGERGIVCQMQITPESRLFLNKGSGNLSAAIRQSLEPLLDNPPNPAFTVQWNETSRTWQSEFAITNELPQELQELFGRTGYGCLAVETNVGVVHICHAPDGDFEGFANQPIWKQWQLIKMPTTPLLRLSLVIADDLLNPFQFESFLNVAEEDQARILAQLSNQDRLYMAFYGDGLRYRYTKVLPHDEQQWQQLDEIAAEAIHYWESLPKDLRDFDQAKADYLSVG